MIGLMSAAVATQKIEMSIQLRTCLLSKILSSKTNLYRRNSGKSRSWSSRPLLNRMPVALRASLDIEVRRSHPSGCDRVHCRSNEASSTLAHPAIFCSDIPTGRGGCLKSSMLWVRIPLGVPVFCHQPIAAGHDRFRLPICLCSHEARQF